MMDARSQYVQLASKWEEKSNIPMAMLGLVYLGTYTAQVLNKENFTLVYQLEIVSVALWVVFAADVLIRLIFSKNVKAFVKSSWLEILALTLPFLRVLRVFRAVIGLRGIKGFVKNRVNATAAYVVMLVPLTWFTGGIAVLDAESNNPDAIISTMREALWWSLATITTVGYGD